MDAFAGDEEHPSVAVVVPVYNDRDAVADCLDRLLAQRYPRDSHEIVVVDNNSSDGTRSAVSPYLGDHDHVRLLVEPEQHGTGATRNCGVRNTDAAVLAFLDVDVAVGPTWLADCVAELRRIDADYMACAVELEAPDEPSIADRYHLARGVDGTDPLDAESFLPASALFVRRSVFDTVGLFDGRLDATCDREFADRVDESGRDRHLASDATVTRPTASSISACIEREIAVGHDRYRLRQLYPERYGRPLLGLVNPARALSPAPGRVVGSVPGWNHLSRIEKLSLCGLDAVVSVADTYGQLAAATTFGIADVEPTTTV